MSVQRQRLKDQSQGVQPHETYEQLPMEQSNKHKNERSSNYTMLVLVVLCLLVVVFANYQFYLQVKQTVRQKEGSKDSSGQRQVVSALQKQFKADLKALQDRQDKLFSKINEIDVKIDVLKKQPKNDATNASQQSFKTVTKEILSFKTQMTEIQKKIQEQSKESIGQIQQLKNQMLEANKKHQEQSKKSNEQINLLMGLVNITKTEDNTKNIKKDMTTNSKEDTTVFILEDAFLEYPKFSKESQIYVDQKHIFDVPKKLWIFKDINQMYLNQLCFKNNIDFAKDSGYDVTVVDRNNFKDYVPKQTAEYMEKVLQMLQKNSQNNDLKNRLSGIVKTLILLNVLNENGGLLTNGQFAMTQDLSWLRNISVNPYVNRGNKGIKPQVVGFYSYSFTFPKEKENIKPFKGMQQVDKYLNIFPTLQDYFISAYAKTEFLTRFIHTIYRLFKQFQSSGNRMKLNYRLNKLKGQDIYGQYFFIAAQIVLQDKQKQIDSVKIDDYRHFAIDYFGLNLINCLYGPYKYEILGYLEHNNALNYLIARYTQEEFYTHVGPILYISKITPTNSLNIFLQQVRSHMGQIIEGSFLHKIFYSHSQVNFLTKRMEKPFVNQTNAQWNSLSKTVWVFWNDGVSNSMINNQICVQSVRRMAHLSGFKFVQVNLMNAAEYIGAEMFQRIQKTVDNTKLLKYPATKSDFIRLALLLKHGGVYMDASMVPVQNLEWIINIGRFPSELIFNRYGELPKVFMTWHPFWGGIPGAWTMSQKYNTKSQWYLGYENAFIVAEKGSELIKDWLQLLLDLYTKSFVQVDKFYRQNRLTSHRWTYSNDNYLIAMETLKCVLARKQIQIEAATDKKWDSASDYYKIWSYSSYFGMQKFRDFLSLQKPYGVDNPFIYQYPQEYVEGLVGKTIHFAKFVSAINAQLNRFISRHADSKFESDVHSQSFFMRHMWNSSYSMETVGEKLRLKVKA